DAIAADRAAAVAGGRGPFDRRLGVAGAGTDRSWSTRRVGRGRRHRVGGRRLGTGSDRVDRGDGEGVGGAVGEAGDRLGGDRGGDGDGGLRAGSDVGGDAVARGGAAAGR